MSAEGSSPATPKQQKKKAPKAAKPKKVASHPKYSVMIGAALSALKERNGSSRQAILKYIMANYSVGDEKTANNHLKLALRAGVKNNSLKQSKGTGASGSFKLADKVKGEKPKKAKKEPAEKKKKVTKKAESSPKKTEAKKKPAAKKPKEAKPKKAPVKKSPAKKAKAPKKTAKKPAAKKAAAKK
ncbi:unnamed protein product [Dimorphilus gyrociliatus]|uniref:H15 domain-containing protein n=1 Tax=Dimorphilus gyrociliatus TaxID=2664684 RepID=A0A7I8V5J8_9ANNE|nr:unnamed protein product [Dimorphilus gyrociliatus]